MNLEELIQNSQSPDQLIDFDFDEVQPFEKDTIGSMNETLFTHIGESSSQRHNRTVLFNHISNYLTYVGQSSLKKNLRCVGLMPSLNSCIGVFGPRKLDDIWKFKAFELGYKLAMEGKTVVTGFARGADFFPIIGALRARIDNPDHFHQLKNESEIASVLLINPLGILNPHIENLPNMSVEQMGYFTNIRRGIYNLSTQFGGIVAPFPDDQAYDPKLTTKRNYFTVACSLHVGSRYNMVLIDSGKITRGTQDTIEKIRFIDKAGIIALNPDSGYADQRKISIISNIDTLVASFN